MDELISRQAAIDAFEDTTFTKNEIRRRLSEVPPAQPEPCEDAVSRKAAIAQMQGLSKWNGIIADSCVDFEDVISVLENKENLPPVTPKQRTGEYVHVSGYSDQYKCTACGIDIVPMRVVKFCPECGTKILKMISGERIIYPWEGDAE